jgi:hypothetical protein
MLSLYRGVSYFGRRFFHRKQLWYDVLLGLTTYDRFVPRSITRHDS